MGVYNFKNFSSNVASPSLYMFESTPLHQEEKIPELPGLWIRLGGGKNNNHYYTK